MVRQSLLLLLSNGTRSPSMTLAPTEAPYDHRGALWYVVTVITVYAMAILFMIVSHVNRRTGKRELDREVSLFLRSAPAVRIEEERQHRRNLKRAMQPFIKLALDRRTVGVYVSAAAESGDLLTQPSIETLTNLSVEFLPVSNRVMKRRWSRARRLSSFFQRPSSRASTATSSEIAGAAASIEGGWRSGSCDEIAVIGGLNDKAIQCGLDPRETLANRASARRLRPVPSETELDSSASSQQHRMMTMMMMQEQQQQQQRAAWLQNALPGPSGRRQQQQQQFLLGLNPAGNPDLGVSASRTHVPRYLANGSVCAVPKVGDPSPL